MLRSIPHILFFFIFLLLSITNCFSQIHLEPANGGNGISGTITSSFTIKWASADSAAFYEYIMSDNPLCFEGCPGDTRKENTPDTTATEFNLQEGKMYYWVTRVYYQNGDTSGWSGVPSSFLAKWTEKEKDEIIKVSPNPCQNKNIGLKIDWAINPKAKDINVELYSVFGVKIREELVKKEATRFQDANIYLPFIERGVYVIHFIIDDNPNNPNNRIVEKVIIQ